MTHVLVQKVLPIHNEAQFAPLGPNVQLPIPPNLAPLPSIAIIALEQWFVINGQPVLTSGDLVPWAIITPPSTGFGPIVGLSHWLVNGKPMATFGIASAPPLGLSISESQIAPYFSA
jgi:uncharacterized Zn-binding protein involved in type VI secretion